LPKKISCKVIKTKIYYPSGGLLVVKAWGEDCLAKPKPIIPKAIVNIDKLFDNLIRESGQLDYYA
jgi:hypothetical protein